MNLQEHIRKVLREEHNKPSKEDFMTAVKDVKVIIPLISNRIIREKGLRRSKDIIIELNKEILKKVIDGDDEILDEMWELAGSAVLRNAINIITHYRK